MKTSALKTFIVAALVFAFGVSAQDAADAKPAPSTSTFTDSRDGKSYKTITFGTQTWMAQNLNYDIPDDTLDVCYDNIENNCAKYGRLYNWAAAKKVCPAGWHLPSDAEWTTLTDEVGGAPTAGKRFKTKTGWYNNGNGVDEFGFSAAPGGDGHGGNFYDAGGNGYWWSSTGHDSRRAWYRGLRCDFEGVGRGYDFKTGQFSVRCLQN